MSLVTYDYSSGSENESDENQDNSTSKVEILPTIPTNKSKSTIGENDIPLSFNSETSNMFEKLPPTRETSTQIIEDKVEDFIPKAVPIEKQRAKVKITIPSLSEFDHLDNEEPIRKKLKPSEKGSGLLSILPPVKSIPISNTTFVPLSLKQKSKQTTEKVKNSKSLIPNSVMKQKKVDKKKINESDESEDETMDLPETFDEELWEKSCGKVPKKEIIKEEDVKEEPDSAVNIAPEPEKPYEGLDNQAFKELVGKSSRLPRNIKLVDLNEEELVPEKELWMTKSLTDPDYVPKKPEVEQVDSTRRKKHHITYLVQRAKESEQELQSAWAASRNNRNASRAKYGF